jgi:hypothetical protein
MESQTTGAIDGGVQVCTATHTPTASRAVAKAIDFSIRVMAKQDATKPEDMFALSVGVHYFSSNDSTFDLVSRCIAMLAQKRAEFFRTGLQSPEPSPFQPGLGPAR